MSVAIKGLRQTETDPPEIIVAKAEYSRLTDEHTALLQKILAQKNVIMAIQKRIRRGTPADIERAEKAISDLSPRLDEAEFALKSCTISRLIRGEITKEQIVSGQIPAYSPPPPKRILAHILKTRYGSIANCGNAGPRSGIISGMPRSCLKRPAFRTVMMKKAGF